MAFITEALWKTLICSQRSVSQAGHPTSSFWSLHVPFGHSDLCKEPQEAWALYRLGREVASMASTLQGFAGFISQSPGTGEEVSSAILRKGGWKYSAWNRGPSSPALSTAHFWPTKSCGEVGRLGSSPQPSPGPHQGKSRCCRT